METLTWVICFCFFIICKLIYIIGEVHLPSSMTSQGLEDKLKILWNRGLKNNMLEPESWGIVHQLHQGTVLIIYPCDT